MVLAEIEESVRSLSLTEKLELIRFISAELLQDERLQHFEQREAFSVCNPRDEGKAARQLVELLGKEA